MLCPVGACPVSFTRSSKLQQHIRQSKDDPEHAPHAEALDGTKCAICGKQFECAKNRKLHERRRTCKPQHFKLPRQSHIAIPIVTQGMTRQTPGLFNEAITQTRGLTGGLLDFVGRDVLLDFTENTALIPAIHKVEDGVPPPTLEILVGADGSSRPPLPSRSQTGDTEFNMPICDELVLVLPTVKFLPQDKEFYLKCFYHCGFLSY